MRRAFCSKTPAPAIRVAFQAQAKMLESRGFQRPAIYLAPNPGQRRRPIRHSERSRLARDRAPESLSPAGAAAAARDAVARGSRLEPGCGAARSEEHTSELQSQSNLVCRLLLEKKNDKSE